MDTPSRPLLPPEIIISIIGTLCPTDERTILSPSEEATRTLLSPTTVCHLTHHHASRLLIKHCMYIDSGWRAKALARSLTNPSTLCLDPRPCITSLFLAPFPMDAKDLDPEQQEIQKQQLAEMQTRAAEDNGPQWESEMPKSSSSADTDDAFDDEAGSSDDGSEMFSQSPLEDLSIASAVCTILHSVAPTLKRLIIDIPLIRLISEKDHLGIFRTLRDGFETLTHLEEFVSVQDELYLPKYKGRGDSGSLRLMVNCWPKLRYLSLYSIDLDDHLCEQLAAMPCLERVVFPRADGPGDEVQTMGEWFRSEWAKVVAAAKRCADPDRVSSRCLDIVHIDVAHRPDRDGPLGTHPKIEKSPNSRLQFVDNLLMPQDTSPASKGLSGSGASSAVSRELPNGPDVISTCQNWVRWHALQGSLWDAVMEPQVVSEPVLVMLPWGPTSGFMYDILIDDLLQGS